MSLDSARGGTGAWPVRPGSLVPPVLLTFDVLGTIVNWRSGLEEALGRSRAAVPAAIEFDAVIDAQAAAEAGPFRPYREIVVLSLVQVAGLDAGAAALVADGIGRWPLFADSRPGLARLLRVASCVAMTNSDREHGTAIQDRLGFRLTNWIAAEEVRVYKPAPAFWHAAAARLGTPFGPAWWHVSAYGDYDLETAGRLGLTRVFVRRAHARSSPAEVIVADLEELATLVERLRA